jgi:hypothetical protein
VPERQISRIELYGPPSKMPFAGRSGDGCVAASADADLTDVSRLAINVRGKHLGTTGPRA